MFIRPTTRRRKRFIIKGILKPLKTMVSNLKFVVLLCLAFGVYLISHYANVIGKLMRIGQAGNEINVIDPYQHKFIFMVDMTFGNFTFCHACAVESASRGNPSLVVILFRRFKDKKDPILAKLGVLENIQFAVLKPKDYFRNKLMEEVYNLSAAHEQYMIHHILPFLILRKYGGIYLTTDEVMQAELPVTVGNFLDRGIDNSIGSRFFGFFRNNMLLDLYANEAAKQLINKTLEKSQTDLLVTLLFSHICRNVSSLMSVSEKLCKGIQIIASEDLGFVSCKSFEQNIKQLESGKMIQTGDQFGTRNKGLNFNRLIKRNCPIIHRLILKNSISKSLSSVHFLKRNI